MTKADQGKWKRSAPASPCHSPEHGTNSREYEHRGNGVRQELAPRTEARQEKASYVRKIGRRRQKPDGHTTLRRLPEIRKPEMAREHPRNAWQTARWEEPVAATLSRKCHNTRSSGRRKSSGGLISKC